MPDPTRPVAGAPIDTDWGQQVHDRVFEPPGVRAHNAGTQSIGTTFEQLQIDIVDDDPGGWLDDDKYIVPTGRGGLYAYWLAVSANGSDGEAIRIELRINGTAERSIPFVMDAGTSIFAINGIADLSAGDELEVYAKTSSGSSTTVIRQFDLIMQGTGIGA